jgi:hypothetical protein
MQIDEGSKWSRFSFLVSRCYESLEAYENTYQLRYRRLALSLVTISRRYETAEVKFPSFKNSYQL